MHWLSIKLTWIVYNIIISNQNMEISCVNCKTVNLTDSGSEPDYCSFCFYPIKWCANLVQWGCVHIALEQNVIVMTNLLMILLGRYIKNWISLKTRNIMKKWSLENVVWYVKLCCVLLNQNHQCNAHVIAMIDVTECSHCKNSLTKEEIVSNREDIVLPNHNHWCCESCSMVVHE